MLRTERETLIGEDTSSHPQNSKSKGDVNKPKFGHTMALAAPGAAGSAANSRSHTLATYSLVVSQWARKYRAGTANRSD